MTVQDTTTTAAPARPGAGERDYHAFALCHEPPGWLATVEDQVATWLRARKQLVVDTTGAGATTVGAGGGSRLQAGGG